jgi:hypothetical protein
MQHASLRNALARHNAVRQRVALDERHLLTVIREHPDGE